MANNSNKATQSTQQQNEVRDNRIRTIAYIIVMALVLGGFYDLMNTDMRYKDADKKARTLIARADSLKTLRGTLHSMELLDGAKMPAELFNRIDSELDETNAQIPAALKHKYDQKLLINHGITWLQDKMHQKSK